MTDEQAKALAIVQAIEKQSSEIFGTYLELESGLEFLKGRPLRAAAVKIQMLYDQKTFLDQLARRIEVDFGIAYECTEEQSWPVRSPVVGLDMNCQCKTMVRVDGETRYDYKITTSGILSFKNA